MKALRTVVAAAMLAISATAAADTITVTWGSPIFSPPGGRNVGVVTFPGGSTNTDAGRFHGTATTSGISPAELVDSAANFLAYCHDLAQTIGSTTTYTVEYGASGAMRDFLGAVNFVLGGGAYAWLHPTDSMTAAAIQLGIWEARYGDDFSLNSGSVQFGSVDADVATLFQTFVNARAGSMDLADNLVMRLTHPDRQDVITGRFSQRLLVPEPATLLLLGIAAALAATTRRRR